MLDASGERLPGSKQGRWRRWCLLLYEKFSVVRYRTSEQSIVHCSYKCFKKSFKVSSFIALSEILSSVSSLHNLALPLNSYRLSIKMWSSSHRPFLASSVTVGYCHVKKQSWYPVSSKLANYLPENWRLFHDGILWTKITDIGSYSVQLFEDLTGVRCFEPQCIYWATATNNYRNHKLREKISLHKIPHTENKQIWQVEGQSHAIHQCLFFSFSL